MMKSPSKLDLGDGVGAATNTTYTLKLTKLTAGPKGVSVVFAVDPEDDLEDLCTADGDTTFALIKVNR